MSQQGQRDQGQWDIVSGIGLTALATAAARAIESSRPDRLMDDPFAAAFVEAAQPPVPFQLRVPDGDGPLSAEDALIVQSASYVGLRARYFDDFLAACSAGVEQAVLLAAGLDARAFRLDWPVGFRLFEIDQPKVLEFKDAVLRGTGVQPRCSRTVVAVDLREDWIGPLRGAGFDPARPTAWMAEGLLPYLSGEEEQRLFGHIHDLSAPGSHLAADRVVRPVGMIDDRQLHEISTRRGIDLGKLMNTEARPDPADWLIEQGWTVSSEPGSATEQRYQRTPAVPRFAPPPASTELRVSDYTAFLSAHRPR